MCFIGFPEKVCGIQLLNYQPIFYLLSLEHSLDYELFQIEETEKIFAKLYSFHP